MKFEKSETLANIKENLCLAHVTVQPTETTT